MSKVIYFFRYLFSFFWPVVVERKQGTVSPLEVCLVNGRYQLNSAHVNYSFGGLHKVFERTFAFLKIQSFNISSVLMLGFGAGSALDILENDYGKKCRVTAIEKDSVVEELYRKYFKASPAVNLFIEDAKAFVERDASSYDMIIMDVFEDTSMPVEFEKDEFIRSLKKRMHKNTLLLWNRIQPDAFTKERNDRLIVSLSTILGPVSPFYTEVNGLMNCVLVVGNKIV